MTSNLSVTWFDNFFVDLYNCFHSSLTCDRFDRFSNRSYWFNNRSKIYHLVFDFACGAKQLIFPKLKVFSELSGFVISNEKIGKNNELCCITILLDIQSTLLTLKINEMHLIKRWNSDVANCSIYFSTTRILYQKIIRSFNGFIGAVGSFYSSAQNNFVLFPVSALW